MARLIPIKPLGTYKLSVAEQNCLSWYVLSNCKKDEAFGAFVRPDLIGNPTLLSQYCAQFFASQPALSYISAYEDTIYKMLHPERKKVEVLTKEEQDQRNAEAVKKIKDWVVSNADMIDTMEEPEELIKIMQRLGMFEDDTVVEESPRRYLPEMCSQCRYKSFVEEECEDDCQFCKYKKYANENGVEYKPERQLDK